MEYKTEYKINIENSLLEQMYQMDDFKESGKSEQDYLSFELEKALFHKYLTVEVAKEQKEKKLKKILKG